jgi:predicted ATPase
LHYKVKAKTATPPSFLPQPVLAPLSSFAFRLAPTPMLERLRIQNFKSWQDTGDMAFGSLTGFFGTNSSGKSSILQFLLMLKQTVESSDRSRVLHFGDDKSYVDLGTMDDILHNHTIPSELSFSFEWKDFDAYSSSNDDLSNLFSLFPNEPYKFSTTISAANNEIVLDQFSYQKNNYSYTFISQKGTAQRVYKLILSTIDNPQSEEIEGTFKNPYNFYGVPNDLYLTHPAIENELQEVEQSFYHLFDSIYYLGPLREFPKRTYVWSGGSSSSIGNRGEYAVSALLSAYGQGLTIRIEEERKMRTVEEHVAHWLKELGLIYSFKVQPIAPNRKEYEVRIQRTAESASVFLTDVGFGVSQILPVLVLLFYVPEGSTVILEQPEIHLHPAVQAGLADVFIDAIKRRKVQIILESHNEHLLQRLQRRIAEEVISQEEIKLYFTSIEEGRSKLTTLELDEYGNIGNWPKGFFGDAFAESAAKTKAEMKRKLRQQ